MRLLKEIQQLIENYHVKSGLYHFHRNEYKQAAEFFRKSLRDEERLTRSDLRNARHHLTLSLMDLATRLEEQGDLEGAIEQLRQATEVCAGFPDLRFRLGRLLEKLDRFDEAIEEYNQALALHGDYLDAQVAMAFCLLRAGRAAEAEEAFKRAMELRKARLERTCEEGMRMLSLAKTESAVERFHDAFLAQPKLCDEHRRKAMSWLKVEEYEKALEEFDRASEVCPGYPDLHNLRGVVLCELDRLDEAIEALRMSIKLSPKFVVPRLNLAFALVRAEEYRAAETELESVLRLDPTERAAQAKLEEIQTGRLPDKRRSGSRGNAR